MSMQDTELLELFDKTRETAKTHKLSLTREKGVFGLYLNDQLIIKKSSLTTMATFLEGFTAGRYL